MAIQISPPHLCDMDIWILDMLLAEAAMDVIGSDEGFRRAVPHQEGGLTRHGSMAAWQHGSHRRTDHLSS